MSSTVAPFFLVGASRSGTTLLRLMLNEHPDLAIPSESHFLGPLLERFRPEATLDQPALEAALVTVTGFPQWQDDFRQTEAELRAAVGAAPITLAAFIDRLFRLEIGSDADRWGDKSPPYVRWVGKLLTCFPDGQAIAIVRDPRDVYQSLVRLGWFGSSPWRVGAYLAQCGRFIERWRSEFPPERFTVVRYEDLVLETESTLRTVCAFLGIDYVPAMHAYFEHADRNVPARELDVHHTKLLRAPAPDDVYRWRREGSRAVNAEVEALTVRVIDRYGYDRTIGDTFVPLLRTEARLRHHALTKVRRAFHLPS